MKRIIALMLSAILLLGIAAFPAFNAGADRVKKGDMDGDGTVTVADALAALRIAAKLTEASEYDMIAGDTDKDGTVTVADALAILRVAAKLATFDDDGETEKILTIQVGYPETLSPALVVSDYSYNMAMFAFDCLLNLDENDNVIPGAAESWSVSDDGLVWTFNLRSGLKWSDGSDLTARDFEAGWKYVAAIGDVSAYGDIVLGNVKGYYEGWATAGESLAVTAKDNLTLEVTLNEPDISFPRLVTHVTLSPIKVSALAGAALPGDLNTLQTYVCNGPFCPVEYKEDTDDPDNSYVLFRKNPYYRNADRVKLDGIKCLLTYNSEKLTGMYLNGQALMIRSIDEESYSMAEIKNMSGFRLLPMLGTYYVAINTNKAPLNDARVRKALSLAADRSYLANEVLEGLYFPAVNLVGNGILDYDGTAFMSNANGGTPYIDINSHTANVAVAKQLLAEAGYTDGFTVSYSTNDSTTHVAVANYLKEAFAEIGVTLNVNLCSYVEYAQMLDSDDAELIRGGWICDYNDPAGMLNVFMSDSHMYQGKYSNSEFDSLMDRAGSATSARERSSLLHQAEDILMNDTAFIGIGYYADYCLLSESVTGAWFSPETYWHFEYADITG